MNDRRVLAFGQRSPKTFEVACPIGIDNGQLVARGDLNEAQFGAERVFRDKFRVDSNAVDAGKPLA